MTQFVSGMEKDVPTIIAALQKQLQEMRDLALLAPKVEQRAAILQTAKMIEQCIRTFDKYV